MPYLGLRDPRVPQHDIHRDAHLVGCFDKVMGETTRRNASTTSDRRSNDDNRNDSPTEHTIHRRKIVLNVIQPATRMGSTAALYTRHGKWRFQQNVHRTASAHLRRPGCCFFAAVGDCRTSHQAHIANLTGIDPAIRTQARPQLLCVSTSRDIKQQHTRDTNNSIADDSSSMGARDTK